MDKYILFTPTSKTEYEDLETAIKAYAECSEYLRFLYQPDKIYFLGTLSSTGSKIGHDHLYHRDVAKCTGLFMADNKNQIKTYLEKSKWYHQGSSSRSTKARLYGNGPYGSLYQSNLNDDWYGWPAFERAIQCEYLTDYNISYFHKIESSFGAVDVSKGPIGNPYKLY